MGRDAAFQHQKRELFVAVPISNSRLFGIAADLIESVLKNTVDCREYEHSCRTENPIHLPIALVVPGICESVAAASSDLSDLELYVRSLPPVALK